MNNTDNIIITTHAKERYSLRFKNIDKYKISDYSKRNSDIIERDLLKIYKFSNFLYRGSLKDNNKSYSYYINNDILLVLLKNKIITVYRIMYNTDDVTNKEVIESLRERILENNQDYDYKKKIIKTSKKNIRRCEKIIRNSNNKIDLLKAFANMQVMYANKLDCQEDIDSIKTENTNYAKKLITDKKDKVIIS